MSEEPLNTEEEKGASMPFLQHLEELRWRLFKSLMAIVVMAMVAFYFAGEIITFIKMPFGDTPLYNIQVTGTLYAYLKVALFAGVIGALPIVFYQLWSFISPGLYKREKAVILPMVAISTVLFLIGAGFCFVIVLPVAFQFFMSFDPGLVQNIVTISSYIDFVGLMILAFGFGFQMPVIAYFLGKLGIITASFLCRGRRYALPVILTIAAILTPTPDIFTQLLLAGPLYFLYEVSIVVVRTTQRKKHPKESPPGARKSLA